MLRASSLGLLPLSLFCSQRPCFVISRASFILHPLVKPYVPRQYSRPALNLERNDGKRDHRQNILSQHHVLSSTCSAIQVGQAHHVVIRESEQDRPYKVSRPALGFMLKRLSSRRPRYTYALRQGTRLRNLFFHDTVVKKQISRKRKRKAVIPSDSPARNGQPYSPSSRSTGVRSAAPLVAFPLRCDGLDPRQIALLETISSSWDAAESWGAYCQLLHLPPSDDGTRLGIPLSVMHRLGVTLATHRPRTRTMHLWLQSVLVAIREGGGRISLREWNALIACASGGLRRVTPLDYENAVSYFRDMTQGHAPGTTLARRTQGDRTEEEANRAAPIEPDIYTYTTLLNIAARSGDSQCFRHASFLLESSGLQPNRITHLALVKYFKATRQLSGVRSTLAKMEHQALEVGIDGVNNLLMAYAYNKRLDTVRKVYRLLRHNIVPETGSQADELASIARQLQREEFICVLPQLVPDEITYTCVIQIMAYHGDLDATLNTFIDMLSTPNTDNRRHGPGRPEDNAENEQPPYQASFAVFRAIFLGFSRHGVQNPPRSTGVHTSLETFQDQKPEWTLSYLQTMFNAFMDMSGSQVNRSVAYWVMMAFKKTSDEDKDLLRRVFTRMVERFPGLLGGKDNRLRRIKEDLFRPDGKGGYL